MWKRRFLACVLVLGFGTLVIGDDPCTFPEFLQTDGEDYWLYHVTLDGIKVKVTVNDINILAEQIGWTSEQGVVFSGKCHHVTADEEYVIEFQNNTETMYNCFTFSHVASGVVLLYSGIANDTSDETVLCPGIEQAEWLLVANKPKSNDVSPCQLTGGFTFTATSNISKHKEESVALCPGHPVPSLLESDCTDQEGLRLTFPDHSCVPGKTGWTTDQNLMCLDSWQQEYGSTAVTLQLLGVNFEEPKWCMRIPQRDDLSIPFTVQIFQDLTCPPSLDELEDSNIPYIELTMEEYDTGECKDLLTEDQCSSSLCSDQLLAHYCRKTCKLCDPNDTSLDDTPGFDKDVIPPGIWQDIQIDGAAVVIHSVTFTENTVTVENFTELQCHQQVDSQTYITKAKIENKPGCRARYSCAKFQRLAPEGPVLAYKLGQNVLTSYDNAYEVCSEGNFADDPPPLGVTLHSRNTKNLIATDEELLKKTVPCGFGGNFSVEAQDGSFCFGLLSDINGCEPQNEMTMQLNCSDSADFSCLAEFVLKDGGPRFVVSSTGNDTSEEYNCWVRTDATDGDYELYQMTSPQCNDVTYEQIQAEVADVALAAHLKQVDNCAAGDTTTPTTTISTTTKTTPTTTTTGSTSTTPAGSSHQTAAVVFGVLFGLLACVILAFIGYKCYVRRNKMPYRVL